MNKRTGALHKSARAISSSKIAPGIRPGNANMKTKLTHFKNVNGISHPSIQFTQNHETCVKSGDVI